MSRYFDHMTVEQQAVITDFEQALLAEVKYCVEKLKAIDAIGPKGHVKLPAIAASGKAVLAGANFAMYNRWQYYIDRLQLAARALGDKAREVIPEPYNREVSC